MGHIVDIERPHRSTNFFQNCDQIVLCFDRGILEKNYGWKVKYSQTIYIYPPKNNCDEHLVGG